MLTTIRRIPVRAAGWVALVFYASAMLIIVLVLASVIPVTSVAGSGIQTLGAYAPVAIGNIAVFVLGAAFVVFTVIAGRRPAGGTGGWPGHWWPCGS